MYVCSVGSRLYNNCACLKMDICDMLFINMWLWCNMGGFDCCHHVGIPLVCVAVLVCMVF